MVARPTITASTPKVSKARFASSPVVMSPLPMIGMCMRGFSFTLPMSVQSAEPVYIWARVRPWMVRAWMPTSWRASASSTMILLSLSQPRRVFTVTGIFTALTISLTMRSMTSGQRSIPLPAPLPATRLTGQPKFRSSTSGPAASAMRAASTMGSTSRP